MSEDIRSYNVGASDYATHKYQSWDFWMTYRLNPFDADLEKRLVRVKKTDGRKMDFQKIKHICGERIRQLENGRDCWRLPKRVKESTFNEMIADYSLSDTELQILQLILYPTRSLFHRNENRIKDYRVIQRLCDEEIKLIEFANTPSI